MKRPHVLGGGRLLFLLLSLAVLLPLSTSTFSRLRAQSGDGGEDSIYKELSIFTEVLSLIRRNYVEETSLDRLFSGALDGTVDALDPLATYVPAEKVDAYEKALAIGSAHSGLTIARQRGITYVLAVEPGSPGEAAEISGGDILAEIDDHSTRQMPLWEVERVLAGPPGESLAVELLRRGQTVEAELVLAAFERSGPSLEIVDGTAILTIRRFSDELPGEIGSLLGELEGHDRLLIDLRGAAGGSSAGAYAAAGHFVQGALGVLADRHGTLEEYEEAAAPLWNGRLVVLTDRSSQGAAEIFAAVLSQGAGAELVGQRTFGHAGRRSAVKLSNGAEVHFTDAFYAGPDGEVIDGSLVPETLVTEISRSLSEGDIPLDELMLKRAIERLEAEPAAEKAA